MAKFDPKMLVAASEAPEFAKGSNARTTREAALDSIGKLKAAWAGNENSRNLRVRGERVGITVRVGSSSLVLRPTLDAEGKPERDLDGRRKGDREMTSPKTNVTEALDYFADQIKAGAYDDQLAELDEAKASTSASRAQTRAQKKAEKAAKTDKSA